jgi:hypothetical protein
MNNDYLKAENPEPFGISGFRGKKFEDNEDDASLVDKTIIALESSDEDDPVVGVFQLYRYLD